MSEKRLDTVSARITPDLHQQIALLAHTDGITLSDLINNLLVEYRDGKLALHLQLSRAFDKMTDLQDKQ